MALLNDPNVIRGRRNMALEFDPITSGQGLAVAPFVPVKKKDFLGYGSTR
jgi:hypothetical protein